LRDRLCHQPLKINLSVTILACNLHHKIRKSKNKTRCHYGVAIVNSTISHNLNNSSQPICINDFEFIRMETILELRLQTVEDAYVEVSEVLRD